MTSELSTPDTNVQWEKPAVADVYVTLQLVHGQCLARFFLAHRANSSDCTRIRFFFFSVPGRGRIGVEVYDFVAYYRYGGINILYKCTHFFYCRMQHCDGGWQHWGAMDVLANVDGEIARLRYTNYISACLSKRMFSFPVLTFFSLSDLEYECCLLRSLFFFCRLLF